ncbi:MAG: DNA polymerase III delta prime subunit [Firmicutes bacterium]|nr:DNA polymerase III delta prime subunit [Bacillota bacterium]MDI6705103.1 DNA polymerase III subunit delta' C-terminal domain-containing protein [Bacillota bacterium]
MNLFEALSEAAKKNKVSHAYIIRGEDKDALSLALHLAMAVNCQSGILLPCGECSSCRKAKSANHPDISVLECSGESIGIDAIRNMQKEIYIKPYEGKKRVYVIADGGRMTVQAQNCLLKMLEEPPRSGIIIITVENQHNLLPTVVSRCQLLKLDTGLRGLDHPGYKDLVACFLEEDFMNASARIEELSKGDSNTVSEFLDYLLMTLRDILLSKVAGGSKLLYIKNNDEFIRRMAANMTYRRLDKLINAVINTQEKNKYNANSQLALEVLLLQIQEE